MACGGDQRQLGLRCDVPMLWLEWPAPDEGLTHTRIRAGYSRSRDPKISQEGRVSRKVGIGLVQNHFHRAPARCTSGFANGLGRHPIGKGRPERRDRFADAVVLEALGDRLSRDRGALVVDPAARNHERPALAVLGRLPMASQIGFELQIGVHAGEGREKQRVDPLATAVKS